MKKVVLGKTGIVTVQNAFGALPIQRISKEAAVELLRKAYEGGMTFFDTARGYTDSEEKLGAAFEGMREKVIIATKTPERTPEAIKENLCTSLEKLKTDYIDIYQLHCADRCYAPGDGTGVYECLLELKEKGLIRHIGITAHKIGVAEDVVESGLYETLQYPFSYLSSEREIALVNRCKEKNIGFIAMKGLSGGLITKSDAIMAFTNQFDNVVAIWGIQRMSELLEWLSYMDNTPEMNEEYEEFIKKEREELNGDFCRGCGYCKPCPENIQIETCARMSLLLRRAPSANWLTKENQAEMAKIENCRECGLCKSRCPYELNTPELLKKNLEDYKKVVSGEVKVC